MMVFAAWAARLVVSIAVIAATPPAAALVQDIQLGAAIYFPASGHVIAGSLASDPGVLVRFKPPALGQSQFVDDFSTLWSSLAGGFVGATLADSGEAGTDPLAVFAASTSPPRLVILDCHAFRIAAVPTLSLAGVSAVFTTIAGLSAQTSVFVGSNDGYIRAFSIVTGAFGPSFQLRCPISSAPLVIRSLVLAASGTLVYAAAWFGSDSGTAASQEVLAANGTAGYRARIDFSVGHNSSLLSMGPATSFASNSTPIAGPGLATRFAAQPPSPLMGFASAMAASADGAALVYGLAGTSYDEYSDGGQLQGPTLMASAGADGSAATVATQLHASPPADLVAAAVVKAPPAGAAAPPSYVGCAAADNLAFAEAGARVMCVPIAVEPTTGAVRLGAPTLIAWSTTRNSELTGLRSSAAECRGDAFPATIAVPLANTSRILFLTSARTDSSAGGDAGRDVVIGDLVDVSVNPPLHSGSFVLPLLGALGGGTVVSLRGAPALVQLAAASNSTASATASPSGALPRPSAPCVRCCACGERFFGTTLRCCWSLVACLGRSSADSWRVLRSRTAGPSDRRRVSPVSNPPACTTRPPCSRAQGASRPCDTSAVWDCI
jgi:hypothetical protein